MPAHVPPLHFERCEIAFDAKTAMGPIRYMTHDRRPTSTNAPRLSCIDRKTGINADRNKAQIATISPHSIVSKLETTRGHRSGAG